MKIKKLHIWNYKSLVDLELIEPNPFTVFAGPNGAGKSNIFEAIEFLSYNSKLKPHDVELLFGGKNEIFNFRKPQTSYGMRLVFENFESSLSFIPIDEIHGASGVYKKSNIDDLSDVAENLKSSSKFDVLFATQNLFFVNFLRLFIGKDSLNRIKYNSEKKILPDASNLSSVIRTILINETTKNEFVDWIQLFIPGFENIEIYSDNVSREDTLLIFEKGTKKPFTRNLISDGSYNILSILSSVYQSTQPQFLCIEEPENGLNPYVIKTLVDFFRKQCEEKGHYIWLNTHSQTLVKQLRPEELILVDKVDGATKVKQFPKDYNLHGLQMDEAWLSNALGGGVPW